MDQGRFTRGFLVGGLLGAALALLYTPRSGKNLRSDIRSRANGIADRVKQRADGVVGRTRNAVQAFRDERDRQKQTKEEIAA